MREADNDIHVFEAGKTKLKQYANMGDGLLVEYSESNGFNVWFMLNKPDFYEENSVLSKGSTFIIGLTEIDGCGFITIKFGMIGFSDCVFEPSLYADNKEAYDCDLGYNEGLSLMITLVDPSREGLIKGFRLITLSHEFSTALLDWCKERVEKHMDDKECAKIRDEVFKKYTSEDLFRMAKLKWRIN